ncbi:DUF169 domain-containing protein [Oceanidesulfovibrio marinus]|uniref:DUF169 domain-containing protein n=1 Tax=Oceanidesulfovibrio marinus TaxID=370038 RepID=A0A6P1ZJ98_9BACT|nr:DUF169 domain-containing protein [Oceanidesulfovibrio marinus]QJT08074.1 hypothetical protein E8L03_03645 [Oceanidesulfovibrio marinus]TVM34890.1 hypothetical protein DQK91_05630 [Oceanidesulfovibrio marinus]
MDSAIQSAIPDFLELLGLDEEPVGLFYTDKQPEDGSFPKQCETPTREREQAGEIDWPGVFGKFSCVMRHILMARKQKKAAWFAADHFGCPGAAFWLGFIKPQTDTIINYISAGIPGWSEGELYCESPEALGQVFQGIDPRPAPKPYLVIKPLSLFTEDEEPELVIFFTRPEPLGGLHQLAFFVTNDPEVVQSPWASSCGTIVTWPLRYLSQGLNKAVTGGWDPSARKFFKVDELSFTVPYAMFQDMVARGKDSFLDREAWLKTVRKKIARSKQVWSKEK